MQKFIALLVSVSAANSSNALILPPSIPAAWPSIDQSVMISGAFLNDPLVTNALTYVESVVSPRLLAIMPSSYILESTVTYGADPIANCYWPRGACARASDTADFKADVSSCPSENDWGLTYDDGPTVDPVASGNDTPGIRKALAAANLKATFFIVGSNAIRFPQEILNTYNVGHQIGVHTWTHHPLTSLTNAQIVAEIKFTEAIIYKTIGVVPKYFRPPYGDIDDRVRAILSALGYRTVLWTTTPYRDTTDADVVASISQLQSITSTIKSWFVPQPGFISLEHDIDTFTSSIAISVIGSIKSASGFPLNPKPVGSCLGDSQWYWNATVPAMIAPNTPGSKNASTTSANKPAKNGGARLTINAGLLTLMPAALYLIA